MPAYTYKARDISGRAVQGVMEAVTKVELTDKLHKMGYMATSVTEAAPRFDLGSFTERFRSIRDEDMIMFHVQLSNMMSAGIGLLASLRTLLQQIENRRLRDSLASVMRSVEGGDSFSEALARHPSVFPKIYVDMVRAGEASGKLDVILARLAVFTEQQADLKQKIREALFYPCILLCFGLVVMLAIVTYVIPQFAEIFMKADIPLPLPTLLLYGVGLAIKQFWFSWLLFFGALAIGLQLYAGTPSGKLQMDRLRLGTPVLGSLFRRTAISRFARTLGMLIGAGVPILQSLDMVHEVIANEVLARLVRQTRVAVEKGEKISESLKVSEAFPPDTLQMIAVGEESGRLDEMLNKISDFYDKSMGYSIRKVTAVLEPILLGIMGCFVGFIMASMLLPMFDMMQTLRHG